MVCLWCDTEDGVYYEVLKQGETLNAEMYCHEHWEIDTDQRYHRFIVTRICIYMIMPEHYIDQVTQEMSRTLKQVYFASSSFRS